MKLSTSVIVQLFTATNVVNSFSPSTLYSRQQHKYPCTFQQHYQIHNNPHRTIRYATIESQSQGEQQETTINNDIESIDKAPCYDGICSSEPVLQSSSNTLSSSNVQDSNNSKNGKLENDPNNPSEPSSTATTTTTTTTSPRSKILDIAPGPTVWSEFGRLAHPNIANLGQGFPNWLPPQFAIDALVEGALDSAQNSPHQYTRTAGHVNLVKELAGRYGFHMKRNIDPMGEVAVTVGASQALYIALQTVLQPGDEVILFEPFFDLYVNQIKLAGGVPVYVPLTFRPYDDSPDVISGGEWILDKKILQKSINSKTRAIILNSPHNPTGKVFTRSEMQDIATVLTDYASPSCIVISDEVYKYIIHAPPMEEIEQDEEALFMNKSNNDVNTVSSSSYKMKCQGHVTFATLPNMWERTITISSAGKTFSATGWQVGWAIGPKELISPMHQLLPYVQFCASTVIQEALARALPRADMPYENYDTYYEYLKAMYTRKRDYLNEALRDAGFGTPSYDDKYTPGGGFFIFARIGKNIADAIPKERLNAFNPAAPGERAPQDWALCQWLAEERGILCIPATPFFSSERVLANDGSDITNQFVRIAFCKTDDTLRAAIEALSDLKSFCKANSSEVKDFTKTSGNSFHDVKIQ